MTQHKKVPVYELGLACFRDDVVRSARIKERLLAQLLALIERERQGERVNRAQLRTVIAMLVDLGKEVYARDFERPFLERTAEFYQRESAQILAHASAAEYVAARAPAAQRARHASRCGRPRPRGRGGVVRPAAVCPRRGGSCAVLPRPP